MNRFQLHEMLGEGTYSKVYKATEEDSKEIFALKVCDTTENIQELLVEALLLSQINHPNIVKCYDILFDLNKIIFKMELMTTNIRSLKMYIDVFTYNQVRNIMKDVLHAVQYLHEKYNIQHCDLKPENILYCNKTKVYKISDFNSVNISDIKTTPGCTIWYRAPESFFDEIYTDKSDVWSLGCILYELLTGSALFPVENEDEREYSKYIIKRLGNDHSYSHFKKYKKKNGIMFDNVQKEVQDLLIFMLKPNPEDRLSIMEILTHPFFNY